MKELKSLQVPQEVTNPKPINRLGKLWKTAKRKHLGYTRTAQNRLYEHYYMEILNMAKTLFATLPDEYSRTVFEKDYREDTSENSFTMHCFIAPSFYWYLECDLAYYYNVEFDFYNCPFEEQIRGLISKKFFLLPNIKQQIHQPNNEEFLKRVFKVQDKKYTFTL